MADFNALIDTIKKAALDAIDAHKPVFILYGTVTRENPLEINVEQKMTLRASQLILTRNVTDYTIEMTVNHWTENETDHTHNYFDQDTGMGALGSQHRNSQPTIHRHAYIGRKSFRVHNGLRLGESVILIRVQGGQKFVVIDKVS